MICDDLPLQCLTGLTYVSSADPGDPAAFDDNETNNAALLWAEPVCAEICGELLLSTLAQPSNGKSL